jgi:hypothetical protein
MSHCVNSKPNTIPITKRNIICNNKFISNVLLAVCAAPDAAPPRGGCTIMFVALELLQVEITAVREVPPPDPVGSQRCSGTAVVVALVEHWSV